MTKILIFFATYNEAGNVTPLLTSITKSIPNADILIVDDNSSDGTADTVRSLGLSRVNMLVRKEKLGLGTAHLLALTYARYMGYDMVVTMDGDLSHDPSYIPSLLQKVASGADMSIGSRYMPGGSCDYTGYRLYVSRLGNIAARILLRINLHEFTTSFRAFKVASLEKIDFGALLVDGYSFFMTMVAEAASSGLKIVEAPIHFRERGYGVSKIPAFEVFRGMKNLGRLAVRKMFSDTHVHPLTKLAPCANCRTSYSFIEIKPAGKADGSALAGTCVFCGFCSV